MMGLKLFMVLLGCKPPGRHIEQHDVFFGIAATIEELIPEMKLFWPDGIIHIDAWREVNVVDGCRLNIIPKGQGAQPVKRERLFFINLGGYQENKFEEQHYIMLTVKQSKGDAFRKAKDTLFYRHNQFDKAVSHIDDKYGVDVDDLYDVEEMLSPALKEKYQVDLIPTVDREDDLMHLGYIKITD
jgi:hypothetical protein